MRHSVSRATCVSFLLLAFAGCGGGEQGTLTVDLTGRWSGSWAVSGSSGTFEIDLEHDQDRVTGTGSGWIGGFQVVRDARLEAKVSGATLSGTVEDDSIKLSFKLRLDDSEVTLRGSLTAKLQGQDLEGEVEMKRADET